MKFVFLLLLLMNPVKDLNKVAEVNSLKKEAKEAYTQGKYDLAIANYEKLVSEYGITNENVSMNLANAYFKSGAKDKATELYKTLSQSQNGTIRSIANNQLGVMANAQKKKEEAINYFKEALKADPTNEAARFNYIKLKKEKEQQQQQNKDNKNNQGQNKDQQNKDQQQQDQNKKDQQKDKKNQQEQSEQQQNKQNEQEKQEQQEQNEQQQEEQEQQQQQQQSTAEKLKEMNMTQEKAEMILEAMRNNEIQYIQQNRKKPKSNVDDGKPDW